MRYIVCYDIEDTKNRTKLFEKLKDLGLISIQKSVFYGELIKPEIKVVKGYFKYYCKKGDKAIITPVKFDINDTFGYEYEDFILKEFDII